MNNKQTFCPSFDEVVLLLASKILNVVKNFLKCGFYSDLMTHKIINFTIFYVNLTYYALYNTNISNCNIPASFIF